MALRLPAAVLLSAACLQAAVAQTYPTKPVRVVLPQIAGSGPSDVSSRAFAQELAQIFGQPFIIENRPGANGIIGAQAVAKSAPDGYTLMVTSASTISLNPFMYQDVPYDPPKDFAGVVLLGFAHQAVIAQPSLPGANLREVLDLAKQRPGKITWGSFGPSSASHLYIAWLKNAKDIDFYNVPYKAAGQALQGVVGGQVDMAIFALGGALPLIKAGKIKALAVTGDARNAALPGVPSMKESGIEVVMRNWYGMFAPIATPRDIVGRLNGALAKILKEPKMQEFLATKAGLGVEPPVGGPPEAFDAFLRQDREAYREIVKVTGAKG